MTEEIKLSEHQKFGEDYVIRLEFPDGRQVNILVPNPKQEDGDLTYFLQNGEAYGLNLVSRGHYT